MAGRTHGAEGARARRAVRGRGERRVGPRSGQSARRPTDPRRDRGRGHVPHQTRESVRRCRGTRRGAGEDRARGIEDAPNLQGTPMTARIIDGKAIAADLRAKVATEGQRLRAEHGLQPGLAVVLVGENPASAVYVRSKGKQTVEAGMKSFDHRLPEQISESELLAL